MKARPRLEDSTHQPELAQHAASECRCCCCCCCCDVFVVVVVVFVVVASRAQSVIGLHYGLFFMSQGDSLVHVCLDSTLSRPEITMASTTFSGGAAIMFSCNTNAVNNVTLSCCQ